VRAPPIKRSHAPLVNRVTTSIPLARAHSNFHSPLQVPFLFPDRYTSAETQKRAHSQKRTHIDTHLTGSLHKNLKPTAARISSVQHPRYESSFGLVCGYNVHFSFATSPPALPSLSFSLLSFSMAQSVLNGDCICAYAHAWVYILCMYVGVFVCLRTCARVRVCARVRICVCASVHIYTHRRLYVRQYI